MSSEPARLCRTGLQLVAIISCCKATYVSEVDNCHDSVEVPKDIFLHHFWWCWDRLQVCGHKTAVSWWSLSSDSLFAFNSLHLESRCIFLYSKISVTRVCILHLGVSCSDKLAPAFTIQGMCAWTYSMSGGNLCCLGWCRTRREDARVLLFPHYFGNPYVYCWTGDHYETATCNGE